MWYKLSLWLNKALLNTFLFLIFRSNYGKRKIFENLLTKVEQIEETLFIKKTACEDGERYVRAWQEANYYKERLLFQEELTSQDLKETIYYVVAKCYHYPLAAPIQTVGVDPKAPVVEDDLVEATATDTTEVEVDVDEKKKPE